MPQKVKKDTTLRSNSDSALDNEKIQRQLQEILGNPLEKAIEFAEKGVRINPNNQRAQAILALVRFYSNELAPALEEVKRAFELNPNSLFVLDGLTYIMILSGEWDRGTALARKVIRLNPFLCNDRLSVKNRGMYLFEIVMIVKNLQNYPSKKITVVE